MASAGAFLTLSVPLASHYLEDPLEAIVLNGLMASIALWVVTALFLWLITWIPGPGSAARLWRQLRLEDGGLMRVYSRDETPHIEELVGINDPLRRAEGHADLAVCAEGRVIATLEEARLSIFTVDQRTGQASPLGDSVRLHGSVPADIALLGLRRNGHDKVVVVMTGGSETVTPSMSDIAKPWDDWPRTESFRSSRCAAFIGPTLLSVDSEGGVVPLEGVPHAIRETVLGQVILAIDSAVIGGVTYLAILLRSEDGIVLHIVDTRADIIVRSAELQEVPQTATIMRELGWGANGVTALCAFGRTVSEYTTPMQAAG